MATAQVGQLWSWDITMLQGPRKQDRYLLYLAIDVFSRYPVAWRIEYAETTQMAVLMFAAAFEKYGVPLVLHADNGASMRSTGLLDALESAGVSASYARPRVSDDNPFSDYAGYVIMPSPNPNGRVRAGRRTTGGESFGIIT
ncbi:DDE-type integrase/transposase/recombinase [Rhodococcus opacus]|uniref:DDE-type integrase/transposase/recombinase n=1 Tax=Rhodococcus opacus TaxID=37919 RepID=UPI00080B4B40|nr:DDE-type integrase/transposase/recombinase [Rhodococcus opacus]